MDSNQQLTFLNGGAEEWLRRIAVGPTIGKIPDPIAFALVAMGLAQKAATGEFEATAAGKAYLDAQGIALDPPHRSRQRERRRFYK